MILERYIVREITAPLVAICTVLIIIFGGYSTIRLLNDAVNGLLSGETIAALVSLKMLIALEVLIPVTLYLSVVLALSRLYADGEIIAMESSGMSQRLIITSVFFLALLLSLSVTWLSLYARPWAYEKIYALDNIGRNEFDINKVEAGRFYDFGDNLVFFAEKFDPGRRNAHNVWIWKFESEKREVTTSKNAYQVNGPVQGQKTLVFEDGYHYVLNLKTGADRLARFQKTVYKLDSARIPPAKYRRKAASTAHLSRSVDPVDIAELQWRFSTGLSTILMSLLAIPLSRVAPRRSKYGKVVVAIILFFVFYNLSLIAKTLVEKQMVDAFPGIWWVSVLHALLVLAILPVPSPLRYKVWRRSRTNGESVS